ncbi:hypothetical protein RJT34_22638 [Clitoria ternatea]|uniref:Uncharacterized protein n=1 Tax=Clitoria ternatea TaxID=43366 RepID=A0AAN9FT93_CLITE
MPVLRLNCFLALEVCEGICTDDDDDDDDEKAKEGFLLFGQGWMMALAEGDQRLTDTQRQRKQAGMGIWEWDGQDPGGAGLT